MHKKGEKKNKNANKKKYWYSEWCLTVQYHMEQALFCKISVASDYLFITFSHVFEKCLLKCEKRFLLPHTFLKFWTKLIWQMLILPQIPYNFYWHKMVKFKSITGIFAFQPNEMLSRNSKLCPSRIKTSFYYVFVWKNLCFFFKDRYNCFFYVGKVIRMFLVGIQQKSIYAFSYKNEIDSQRKFVLIILSG